MYFIYTILHSQYISGILVIYSWSTLFRMLFYYIAIIKSMKLKLTIHSTEPYSMVTNVPLCGYVGSCVISQ